METRSIMFKIISVIIKFLNRINKIIWKIIIFLYKFIKIDEIKHFDGKPEDITYPCWNVPKDYLYGNIGNQNQFECKVCFYIF